MSFSNPSRQSLYSFEDCLSGDTAKVDAAKRAMERIDPGVVLPLFLSMLTKMVDGYTLTIPMPDHPSSFVKEDYEMLVDITKWADVLFLLVDTREARWLPTLLATKMETVIINAAVGFDTFVVMRHGLKSQKERLGCYFCSDIVSPQNVPPKHPFVFC